jgi:hypothetical protein
MTDYHVLDLFCGLGGFNSAFVDADCWDVTTVDIEARFEPDIQADVFELRPSDFEADFDVVLASPPCTQFSTIRSITAGGDDAWVGGEPGTDAAADALALVHHTVGLIRGLAPSYWVLENPRGRLRTFWRPPEATVWYCQYGHDVAKPTDLWGDHPPMRYRRCYHGNDDCHHARTQSDKDHGGGSDNRQGILTESDAAERAKVPYDLSETIRDACEAALDGAVPEQTQLDAAVTDGGTDR